MTYKRAEVLDALASWMAAKDTTAFLRFTTGNQKERDGWNMEGSEGRRGDEEEVGYTLKFARQTELFVFLSTQNYLLGICLGDTRENVVIILWNVSSGWTLVCVVSYIKENNHHVT